MIISLYFLLATYMLQPKLDVNMLSQEELLMHQEQAGGVEAFNALQEVRGQYDAKTLGLPIVWIIGSTGLSIFFWNESLEFATLIKALDKYKAE